MKRSYKTGGTAEIWAKRYERLAIRAAKYYARVKDFNLNPAILKMAKGSILCNRKMADRLKDLGPDWRPPRGTIHGLFLEEGATVEIHDRARKRYAGMFDKNQQFTVEKIIGNRILCSAGEMKVPMLRSHVRIAEIT